MSDETGIVRQKDSAFLLYQTEDWLTRVDVRFIGQRVNS